jgi:hypothetical protein
MFVMVMTSCVLTDLGKSAFTERVVVLAIVRSSYAPNPYTEVGDPWASYNKTTFHNCVKLQKFECDTLMRGNGWLGVFSLTLPVPNNHPRCRDVGNSRPICSRARTISSIRTVISDNIAINK